MPPPTGPRKALPIVLVLTLVASLLPDPWLARLADVQAVVNLGFTPLRHALNGAARWLHPVRRTGAADLPDESVEELYEQAQIWRQRTRAAELRIDELESQLEQIQQLPAGLRRGDVPTRPLHATITGRDPSAGGTAVELNRGERHGVREGTIAVTGGVHLVGRVRSVSAVRSVLVPLTSQAPGDLVRGRVAGAGQGGGSIAAAPLVLLEPVGDGTFTAEAAQERSIAEGDVVYLDDPAWPRAAQAMIIGAVQSIRPKDEQPLRNILVVRPDHQLHDLSAVTLVLETPHDGAAP